MRRFRFIARCLFPAGHRLGDGGELLRHAEERTGRPAGVADTAGGASGDLRVERGLVQSAAPPFDARLPQPGRVRGAAGRTGGRVAASCLPHRGKFRHGRGGGVGATARAKRQDGPFAGSRSPVSRQPRRERPPAPPWLARTFLVAVSGAFAIVFVSAIAGAIPRPALISLAALALVPPVYRGIRQHYGRPYELMPAMGRNVQLHLVFGLLLFGGYMLAKLSSAVLDSPPAILT